MGVNFEVGIISADEGGNLFRVIFLDGGNKSLRGGFTTIIVVKVDVAAD